MQENTADITTDSSHQFNKIIWGFVHGERNDPILRTEVVRLAIRSRWYRREKNEEIKYSLESVSSLICAGTEISLTRTLGGRFLPHWTRQAISTIVLFQIDAVHNEAAVLVPAWLQIVHSSGWQSGCWFQLNDEFESVSRSSSFLFLLNSFRKMELSGATVKVPFSECTGIYSVYTGIVSVLWYTGNTAIFLQ